MKKLIAPVLGVLLAGCATKPVVDITPVKEVQLSRYLGSWHEIARFDHWFERDMSHTKAYYETRKDGRISVTNTGLKTARRKPRPPSPKQPERRGFSESRSSARSTATTASYGWMATTATRS